LHSLSGILDICSKKSFVCQGSQGWVVISGVVGKYQGTQTYIMNKYCHESSLKCGNGANKAQNAFAHFSRLARIAICAL
jgi:hypothetical protein